MSDLETNDIPFDDDQTVEHLAEVLDDSPTQIGPYKILAKLGEGGFGVVYEAKQEEPVKRRVALKVIKPGMDSKRVIARFEAERQALALMTHQNIAKVLGGGLTDRGLPYFVMELVKGEPITEFCDRHKMPLDDRLRLLIPVCHAIQHAHAKSVIHRDLKPSNILVGYDTEGHPTPTVIDFGVAKALNQQLTEKTIYTTEGQMIGTPEYMSPEQAEMSGVDIDTRTDVYSLGVVLYELLTGMVPFGAADLRSKAYAEMQRIIREEDPPRPSTRLSAALSSEGTHDQVITAAKRRHMSEGELSKHLRGELDWVVMKCLDKDRDRRYSTPSALAEELGHYLANEPVEARPPSARYKISKIINRNKGLVASTAAFAAILVLATSISVRFSIIADTDRKLALSALSDRDIALQEVVQRASELEQVIEFQIGQLSGLDPEAIATDLRQRLTDAIPVDSSEELQSVLSQINLTSIAVQTIRDDFIKTIDSIDEQFESKPIIQAELLQTIAIILKDLGLYNLATDPQERALALRTRHLGDDDPITLSSLFFLGALERSKGNAKRARQLYQSSLDARIRILGKKHTDTYVSMSALGSTILHLDDINQAGPLIVESEVGLRRVLGSDHRHTLNATLSLGKLRNRQGDFESAAAHLEEAVQGYATLIGPGHIQTILAFSELLPILVDSDSTKTMTEIFRVMEISEIEITSFELFESTDLTYEIVSFFDKALLSARNRYGDTHPDTLILVFMKGNYTDILLNDPESAMVLYTEALDGFREIFGPDHLVVEKMQKAIEPIGVEIELKERRQVRKQYYHFFDTLEFSNAEHAANDIYAYSISNYGIDSPSTIKAMKMYANLYEAWHETEPDGGHDIQFAEWQAKLDAFNAEPDSIAP